MQQILGKFSFAGDCEKCWVEDSSCTCFIKKFRSPALLRNEVKNVQKKIKNILEHCDKCDGCMWLLYSDTSLKRVRSYWKREEHVYFLYPWIE